MKLLFAVGSWAGGVYQDMADAEASAHSFTWRELGLQAAICIVAFLACGLLLSCLGSVFWNPRPRRSHPAKRKHTPPGPDGSTL